MAAGPLTAQIRAGLRAGRTVALVGPAGIGKSTAISRALRGVDHVTVQCLLPFAAMTYRPLSHALGEPLTGSVEEVAGDVVAAIGDRVLVVEDLHWADRGTAAVVATLVGHVPIVASSRTPIGDGGTDVDEIRIRPLETGPATALAARLHPQLPADRRAELVAAAAGNPLLLQHLARDEGVSPTFRAAVVDRITGLDDAVVDDLGRLALRGRPATAHGLAQRSGGLVTAGPEGMVWFVHDLFATEILGVLDGARVERLRAEVAATAPPADAARHHLALGDRRAAARAAERAAVDADPTARADLLVLAADALGDEARQELLLLAADAAIAAHRPADARRLVANVTGDDHARAEAGLHLARAAWLDGDVTGAAELVDRALEIVAGTGSAVEARLAVERAFVAVRARVGDPSIVELADAAVEIAERVGVDRARAASVAGLARSHTGQHGWAERFAVAASLARDAGDVDEEIAARYWELSALGFYGPWPDAIELGAEMVAVTDRLGDRRWFHHFLGAHVVHLSARGEVPPERVTDAQRLLREAPLFRNRAQVELALTAALVDRGDVEQARAIVTAGEQSARSSEDRALLACARCELALATRDIEAMVAGVDDLVRSRGAFFGVNAVAESAAIHLAFAHPGCVDPPAAMTRLTPVLDVVSTERHAHERQLAGDPAGAIDHCRVAAEAWARRGLLRFARRAALAPVEIALAAGDVERAARRLASLPAGPDDVTARRRTELDREIARRRAARALTGREIEILRLVAQGLTSRQIGDRLGIGATTVDSHVESAMRRLAARSRRQAAALVHG